MFYTGLDPYTLEPVYVARDPHDKAMQRALLQYFMPKNQRRVIEALEKAGRTDLIGHGKDCLVKPDLEYQKKQQQLKSAASKSGGLSRSGGKVTQRNGRTKSLRNKVQKKR